MNRKIFILVFIFIFGKAQANSLEYCSDSDDINDSVFLWQNLFKKINDIISETSELKSNLLNISEDIKQNNKRQTEQELKLSAFMEKTETQFQDLKNRDLIIKNFMENVEHQILDLNKGIVDQKVKVNEFMEKVESQIKDMSKGYNDQKVTVIEYITKIEHQIKDLNKGLDDHKVRVNEYVAKGEHYFKDINKGLNDQKVTVNEKMAKVEHQINDLNKGFDNQKVKVNEYAAKIEHHFQELNKGQKEHKESTTKFVKSANTHFEAIEKGQTEHRQNLKNITDIYLTMNNQWITILRRLDGSEDFDRKWKVYKKGFGEPEGEFFIGLEKLHKLTSEGAPKELMILLEDFENEKRIAKYDRFRIGNESEKYILEELGKYSGDAGDSLRIHKGQKFSTYDQNNDSYDGNCASHFKGGWWYDGCYRSNLCGKYREKDDRKRMGVSWNSWKGMEYSLKYAEMKIRSTFS